MAKLCPAKWGPGRSRTSHGTLKQSVPRWLRRWGGDGIIARVQNQRVARAIAAARIPVIDVLGVVEGLPSLIVHVDGEAIGRPPCRSNGVIAPDDLGVVGVDNDEPSAK